MRPLGSCHYPIIGIRICGDHPVAPTRANILVDLRLVSVGAFLEALGAAVSRRNIHLTVLYELFNRYGHDFIYFQENTVPFAQLSSGKRLIPLSQVRQHLGLAGEI